MDGDEWVRVVARKHSQEEAKDLSLEDDNTAATNETPSSVVSAMAVTSAAVGDLQQQQHRHPLEDCYGRLLQNTLFALTQQEARETARFEEAEAQLAMNTAKERMRFRLQRHRRQGGQGQGQRQGRRGGGGGRAPTGEQHSTQRQQGGFSLQALLATAQFIQATSPLSSQSLLPPGRTKVNGDSGRGSSSYNSDDEEDEQEEEDDDVEEEGAVGRKRARELTTTAAVDEKKKAESRENGNKGHRQETGNGEGDDVDDDAEAFEADVAHRRAQRLADLRALLPLGAGAVEDPQGALLLMDLELCWRQRLDQLCDSSSGLGQQLAPLFHNGGGRPATTPTSQPAHAFTSPFLNLRSESPLVSILNAVLRSGGGGGSDAAPEAFGASSTTPKTTPSRNETAAAAVAPDGGGGHGSVPFPSQDPFYNAELDEAEEDAEAGDDDSCDGKKAGTEAAAGTGIYSSATPTVIGALADLCVAVDHHHLRETHQQSQQQQQTHHLQQQSQSKTNASNNTHTCGSSDTRKKQNGLATTAPHTIITSASPTTTSNKAQPSSSSSSLPSWSGGGSSYAEWAFSRLRAVSSSIHSHHPQGRNTSDTNGEKKRTSSSSSSGKGLHDALHSLLQRISPQHHYTKDSTIHSKSAGGNDADDDTCSTNAAGKEGNEEEASSQSFKVPPSRPPTTAVADMMNTTAEHPIQPAPFADAAVAHCRYRFCPREIQRLTSGEEITIALTPHNSFTAATPRTTSRSRNDDLMETVARAYLWPPSASSSSSSCVAASSASRAGQTSRIDGGDANDGSTSDCANKKLVNSGDSAGGSGGLPGDDRMRLPPPPPAFAPPLHRAIPSGEEMLRMLQQHQASTSSPESGKEEGLPLHSSAAQTQNQKQNQNQKENHIHHLPGVSRLVGGVLQYISDGRASIAGGAVLSVVVPASRTAAARAVTNDDDNDDSLTAPSSLPSALPALIRTSTSGPIPLITGEACRGGEILVRNVSIEVANLFPAKGAL